MSPTADPAVTRKLTKLYLLALTAVALLSIGGQELVQRSLRNQLSDSRVINIAGRQRMLSQKICKTVLLLANAKDSTQQSLYLSDLETDLQTREKSHQGLKNGYFTTVKIPVNNSNIIYKMFVSIEPHFNTMLTNVRQIADSYTGRSSYSSQ